MMMKSLPWILFVVCLVAWAADHYRLQKSLDDVSKLDAFMAEGERSKSEYFKLPVEVQMEHLRLQQKEIESQLDEVTTSQLFIGDKAVPWEDVPKEVREDFLKQLRMPDKDKDAQNSLKATE